MPVYKIILELKTGSVIRRHVLLQGKISLEGKNAVGPNCELTDVSLGRGTYLAERCRLQAVSAGRYCSIGKNVSVINGFHPLDRTVCMHPFFYSTKTPHGASYVSEDLFDGELRYSEPEKGIFVSIGNDVWIGDDVRIMGGVHIGDGAVIGAGALVTKDVPPYSVNTGVPAVVKRYRFSGEQICSLEKLRWWDRDEKWIQDHAGLFSDIGLFLEELRNE